MTAISLSGLGKRFGDSIALHGIDLEMPDGAFVVLLGPSGCGKTTALRMLAGLEDPTSGTIRMGDRVIADPTRGVSVPASKRGIGMVFQSYALWPHMRVRSNIDWPLRIARWSAVDRAQRVAEVLRMLEIEHLADRYPAEISGGQQQRVAIARTIATRPGVLLFDEPLSNLDARLRVDTRAELVRVHRASGATSVYVTHDQTEALAMATHIAVMREGRVEQFGTPDELLRSPATAFVAGFLGTPAAVLLPVGGGRTAMYRSDQFVIDERGELGFEVLESTPLAGRHLVMGLVEGIVPGFPEFIGAERPLRVSIVSETAQRPGARLRVQVPPSPAALFGADGQRESEAPVDAVSSAPIR